MEYQFVFKRWVCWLKVSAPSNRKVSLNLSFELCQCIVVWRMQGLLGNIDLHSVFLNFTYPRLLLNFESDLQIIIRRRTNRNVFRFPQENGNSSMIHKRWMASEILTMHFLAVPFRSFSTFVWNQLNRREWKPNFSWTQQCQCYSFKQHDNLTGWNAACAILFVTVTPIDFDLEDINFER